MSVMCLLDCPQYGLGNHDTASCPYLHRALPSDVCRNSCCGQRCRDYNCSLNHPQRSSLPPPPKEEMERLERLPVELYQVYQVQRKNQPRYAVRKKKAIKSLPARKEDFDKEFLSPRKEEIIRKDESYNAVQNLPDLKVLFIPAFVDGQHFKSICQEFGELTKFRLFPMSGSLPGLQNFRQAFLNYTCASSYELAVSQLPHAILRGRGPVLQGLQRPLVVTTGSDMDRTICQHIDGTLHPLQGYNFFTPQFFGPPSPLFTWQGVFGYQH